MATTKRSTAKKEVIYSASCELTGMVLESFSDEIITSKSGDEYTKADAIFLADGGNGKQLCVTFFGEKGDIFLDSEPTEGAEFDLSVNLSSRSYEDKDGNTKWFTSVDCWKWDEIGRKRNSSNSRERGGREKEAPKKSSRR